MTITAISTYQPSGAVSSVGTGQVLSGGWIDVAGNAWSVNANGYIQYIGNPPNYYSQFLSRPTSENSINQRFRYRWLFSNTSSPYTWNWFRFNGSTTSPNGYFFGNYINTTQWQIYTVVSGNATNHIINLSNALTVGTTYDIDTTVIQTNSTTTTITINFYSIVDGSLVSTGTYTDTTSQLQNVSGQIAISCNTANSNLQIYNTVHFTDEATPPAATALLAVGGEPYNTGVTPPTTIPNIFIIANGTLSSITTVSVSGNITGGSISPTTISIASGTSQSTNVQYTTPSGGNGSDTLIISATGLTSVSLPSFNLVGAPTNYITSNLIVWSPYNWYSNTPNTKQCTATNSYMRLGFTGTSITIVMAASSGGSSNTIAYYVDNAAPTTVSLSSSGTTTITVTGLASGNHTLNFQVQELYQLGGDKWGIVGGAGPTNIVEITSITLDSSASLYSIPEASNTILVYGDSITDAAQLNDGRFGWVSNFAQAQVTLGTYEVGIRGYGGTAAFVTSASPSLVGNVPSLYTAGNEAQSNYDKYDANNSIMTSGQYTLQPSAILINLGQNDTDVSATFISKAVTLLGVLRAAAPNAVIMWTIPFSYLHGADIISAINNYKSNTSDTKVFYLTSWGPSGIPQNNYWLADGSVHPNQTGHERCLALLAPQIQSHL